MAKPSQHHGKLGQVSLEFIMMLSIGFLFAAVLLVVLSKMVGEKADDERHYRVNDLGYRIQDELLLAASVHTGYERTFVLPQTLNKFPYTITNTATSVAITSGSVTATFTIPDVTGVFVKGKNTIRQDGSITIS